MNFQEILDYNRTELLGLMFFNFLKATVHALTVSVRPVGGDCIKSISHRNYPGLQGNILFLQSLEKNLEVDLKGNQQKTVEPLGIH